MIFKFSEVRQSTYIACHDLITRLKLLVKYKFSLDHCIYSVAFSLVYKNACCLIFHCCSGEHANLKHIHGAIREKKLTIFAVKGKRGVEGWAEAKLSWMCEAVAVLHCVVLYGHECATDYFLKLSARELTSCGSDLGEDSWIFCETKCLLLQSKWEMKEDHGWQWRLRNGLWSM